MRFLSELLQETSNALIVEKTLEFRQGQDPNGSRKNIGAAEFSHG